MDPANTITFYSSTRGFDAQSVIADQVFASLAFDAPRQEDVALQPDPPRLKLGFRPIDLTQVGIRPL
jgi:hypothetical protein